MLSRSSNILRVLLVAGIWATAGQAMAGIQVSPAMVVLDNPEASQQLQVRSQETSNDLTRVAKYEAVDVAIVSVDATGLVEPKADGRTEIVIRHGQELVRVPIEVRGQKSPPPVSFESQIIPILAKAGCNAGSCHGKAEGKNGFKLSVFGFDPAADHDALVHEARGRRIRPTSPDNSLFLLKASGQISHGGGRRMTTDGRYYRRLRRWIVEGAGFEAGPAPSAGPAATVTQGSASKPLVPIAPQASAHSLQSIEVEPRQQILGSQGSFQLRVTAIDADRSRHCVTRDAQYDSNAATIATVDGTGWVQASDVSGESVILVRYLGQVTFCRVTIPRPLTSGAESFARPAEANFIDKSAWDQLARLRIPPSDLADDSTFLRRVFLDTIGTLPTVAEAREFLADKRSDKRARLIDRLLQRTEYADYWAMRWSDLLRVDRDTIMAEGALAMTRWLRRQFADNRPYDEWVRDIITARGNKADDGPTAIYKALTTPEEMSRAFSQVFLGVRIQCAQCHHHPSERWSQDDYFALAGLFTGVGNKALPGGGQAVIVQKGTDLKHPRTGKPVPAHALGAAPVDFDAGPELVDRRVVLARWMTAADNPFFARAIANRLWAHYFGRGLVEPLDDLRATNPASNEPLLDELAKFMRDSKYDLKAFTRALLNSRLYQLSSRTRPENAGDEQNFSHAVPKAIPAEVLLDAISQATGVPEKFNGWPEGCRAIQVWDNRMPSYFFGIFGRPVRASVCECERSNEPSIAQALHLMNSEEIMSKVRSRQGTARRLALSDKPTAELIDELYLGTLSRFPNEKEKALMLQAFADAGNDRQAAAEDVLWALLNTRGFVYNH
jgi:hypothetical protein